MGNAHFPPPLPMSMYSDMPGHAQPFRLAPIVPASFEMDNMNMQHLLEDKKNILLGEYKPDDTGHESHEQLQHMAAFMQQQQAQQAQQLSFPPLPTHNAPPPAM